MRIHTSGVARLVTSLVAAASSAIVVSSASADIMIDSFTGVSTANPWPVVHTSVTSTTNIESGVAGVLGANRRSTIDTTTIGLAGLDFTQTTVFTGGPGVFDHASSPLAASNITLSYDGGSSLNADFSTENAIVIDYIYYDGAAAPQLVTVEMFDGVNTATMTLPVTLNLGTPVFFAFAGFSNIGSLDLSSIDRVSVRFDQAALTGADFRLDAIRTVPTPGVLALLAVAGFVVTRTRRRMA